jgi:energy-coupling factor transporter ATP-binding protein EcfA2
MKWKRLKAHQYSWQKYLYIFNAFMIFMCVFLKTFRFYKIFLMGVTSTSIGVLATLATTLLIHKVRQKSRLIEDFIRKNNLMQSHYTFKYGLLGEKEIEIIDYYPHIYYSVSPLDNVFRIRFRLDGSSISRKFRNLEQSLADMFFTICTDRIEERGYITYCFELNEQKQAKIESHRDILPAGENEISFAHNIIWNWKHSPHLLLVGNTGSGKSQLAQYIISCLLNQNVRVIYCDPKNDDDMRAFLKNLPVTYVTKENDIAKAVRETEEQVRLREKDLQSIGIKGYDFRPIFLLFDELIAFSKTAEKKTYDETARRLGTMVVTGRSKSVYVGLILQRPDTAFIEGAIRDNLSCRICMGEMSEAAYKMTFGPDFSHIKNLSREVGSGLIYRQGVDFLPRPFLAPFICKGALNTV